VIRSIVLRTCNARTGGARSRRRRDGVQHSPPPSG
jgi:hypothetical protein